MQVLRVSHVDYVYTERQILDLAQLKNKMRRVGLTKLKLARINVGAKLALRQVTKHPENCGVYHKV